MKEGPGKPASRVLLGPAGELLHLVRNCCELRASRRALSSAGFRSANALHRIDQNRVSLLPAENSHPLPGESGGLLLIVELIETPRASDQNPVRSAVSDAGPGAGRRRLSHASARQHPPVTRPALGIGDRPRENARLSPSRRDRDDDREGGKNRRREARIHSGKIHGKCPEEKNDRNS